MSRVNAPLNSSDAAAFQSPECSCDDSGLEVKAIDHNIAVYPDFKSSSVLPQPFTTFNINTGAPEDTRLTCFLFIHDACARQIYVQNVDLAAAAGSASGV